MSKTILMCDRCGSTDILCKGQLAWDTETQQWLPKSEPERRLFYCNECGADGRMITAIPAVRYRLHILADGVTNTNDYDTPRRAAMKAQEFICERFLSGDTLEGCEIKLSRGDT